MVRSTCRLASGVKTDQAGAGLRKLRHQVIHRLHHQVYVDRRLDAVITQCFANHRPDGEIGHVMIVHYVKMNPVRTGFQHIVHVPPQPGKISRQDGWCNNCRLFH